MKQQSTSFPFSLFFPVRNGKIVIEVIVAILLIVWIHTGISKLIDYRSFNLQMLQSPIFHKYGSIVALAVPIFEIILAILLVLKKPRFWGMVGSFLLMLSFTWYVSYLMLKLPELPCSCGGVVSFLNWPQHLALNVFLTLISLWGIILLKRNRRSKAGNG